MPAKKASTKTTAKKSSKKAGGGGTGFPPPPIPIKCIRACFAQYMACLKKGVDPKLCMKRHIECVQDCFERK